MGPTGPAGPAGEDAEFTIVTVSFTVGDAAIGGEASWYTVSVPEITQEVVDNGAVLVYMNNTMGSEIVDEWLAMPLSMIIFGETYNMMFGFETGLMEVYYFSTSGTWPYVATDWLHYKIVILTEPVKSGVNVENFEEVEAYCRELQLEKVSP